MEEYKRLKKMGWQPIGSTEMQAICHFRKIIYYLSSSINEDALTALQNKLGLGYLDIEGDTFKQKVLTLLYQSSDNGLLYDFFVCAKELKLLPNDFINFDLISYFDEDKLRYLSFQIPDYITCNWEKENNGEFNTKTVHHLIPYANKDNPCETIFMCDICGNYIKSIIEHDWDEWYYINNKCCDKERVCKRCGKKETKLNEHSWQPEIKTPNGSSYQVCSHCHIRDIKIKGKWSGYVLWDNNSKDYWIAQFDEKTRFLIFTKNIVTINVYINVNGNQYSERIVEQGKVEITGNRLSIKCSKLMIGNHYILDEFQGEISKDCLSIKGIVTDKTAKGELILTQS